MYVNDNDNDNSFISINVATKAITVLDEENELIYPSFTADGKIVCDAGWWGGVGIVNADGSNLTILKEKDDNVQYIHPLAIPAHNKIVYVEDNRIGSRSYSIRLMNTNGTGDAQLVSPGSAMFSSPSANAAGTKMAYYRRTGSNNRQGNIIVGNFNGTAISNTVNVFTYDAEGGICIWRPIFNRIDKEVYDALPDMN